MTIDELIEKYSKPSILQLAGTNISIVETGNVKSDLLQLKEGLSTIEYSQKSISYDEAIKVVADTYEMSVDDYEHLWGKGNDYLQVDALSKEITGSSLWDHRNCNFDGFEKVEEEPKYEVVINGKWLVNMFSNRIAIRFVEKNELVNWGANAYKLTELEIKEIDERYWPSAVPVEGVNNG